MKLRTLFFLLSLEAAAGAAPTSLRHDPPKTTHRLSAVELDRTAREAMTLAPPKLPKHATLSAVRCSTSPEVPVSPKLVTLDVSPVPRRAGAVPVTAVLAFYKDDDAPIRVPITLDLDVPASALVADVPKGAGVTLVVTRGLVEVTTSAVTSSDGDLGDVVQVLLKPSGRALRARLVATDRAVAVEDAR